VAEGIESVDLLEALAAWGCDAAQGYFFAPPLSIELATELASLAPGDLNRVFFVSGGSEAVESAWKLARQYYAARGEKRMYPRRNTAVATVAAIAAANAPTISSSSLNVSTRSTHPSASAAHQPHQARTRRRPRADSRERR
jgi:adenosylmethionine-8-amino-7-oxononanoate aminotransferase